MKRLVLSTLALLLILGSGVVHGMRTGRWQSSAALAEAVHRLEGIPERLGEWQGEEQPVAGGKPSGVAAYFCRRYTHTRTGDAVTVFLVCGRPGPVAIHTPDVCYGRSGYSIGPQVRYAPPAMIAENAEFWTADMERTTSADRTRLRVFWAWNAAGGWHAAAAPRMEFASSPVLFKMYLLRELTDAGDPALDRDPAVQLMQSLLPSVNATLFPAS